MWLSGRSSCYLLLVLYSSLITIASSAPSVHVRGVNTTNTLRILPLGDSLTWGFWSTDGNGYRLYLLNLLTNNVVQYVGSQQSGNMTDNYNEGHNGAVIDQIAGYAQRSLPERPNVVLLMAGTNDCQEPQSPTTAATRLGNLIDEVVAACPDAVVLVARIPPLQNIAREAYVVPYNFAMRHVVAQRAAAGNHVLLVDMHSRISTSELRDGIHPTQTGYSLMAQVWFEGLQQAATYGWIGEPVNAD